MSYVRVGREPHKAHMVEARKDRTPGCCIGCDLPLAGRYDRVLCGDPDCKRYYQQIYAMDRRSKRVIGGI